MSRSTPREVRFPFKSAGGLWHRQLADRSGHLTDPDKEPCHQLHRSGYIANGRGVGSAAAAVESSLGAEREKAMWDRVAHLIERVNGRAPGRLLELVAHSLDRLTEALATAIGMLPLMLLALSMGLLVWRRGVVAGVVATAAVGMLGLSRLLPLTLETVAVALVASIVAVMVAGLLTIVTARILLNLEVDIVPGAGAGLALTATVALLPIAELIAGRGVNPAWVATVGLITGVLVTPAFAATPSRPSSRHLVALLVTAIGVSLVGGLVGGWGLGGAVGRALGSGDLPAILDGGFSVLLLVLFLGSVSIDMRRRQAGEGESPNKPSVSGEDSRVVADYEIAP